MSRILLIEDEIWLADCFRTWLEADQHKVWWAGDVQAGLDILEQAVPDVIILDLLLPAANGLQMLHQLPSYVDVANVPVILCSNALPDSLPNMSAYGVRAVLDKTTLTPRILRQTVVRAVDYAAI